jgi:hypothetical protein
MRKASVLVAALIISGAAALGFGQAQAPQPAPKAPAAKEARSLLRKELLETKTKDSAPPLRNIFAPSSGPSRAAQVAPQGRTQPQPVLDFEAADEPAAAEDSSQTPPVITVDLRYIGFIQSPRRLVALVNFEGRAIAVVEGDVVGEGVRIGKVTPEEVEVILPDSSTRTFTLEGE